MRRSPADAYTQALQRRDYVTRYYDLTCYPWQDDVLHYYGDNLLVRAARRSGKSTLLQWIALAHADLFEQRVLVILANADRVNLWWNTLCPADWQERRRIVVRMDRQGRGSSCLTQVGPRGEVQLCTSASQHIFRRDCDMLLVDEASYVDNGTVINAVQSHPNIPKILVSSNGGSTSSLFNVQWDADDSVWDRLLVSGGPHWEQEQEDERRRRLAAEGTGRVDLVMSNRYQALSPVPARVWSRPLLGGIP